MTRSRVTRSRVRLSLFSDSEMDFQLLRSPGADGSGGGDVLLRGQGCPRPAGRTVQVDRERAGPERHLPDPPFFGRLSALSVDQAPIILLPVMFFSTKRVLRQAWYVVFGFVGTGVFSKRTVTFPVAPSQRISWVLYSTVGSA